MIADSWETRERKSATALLKPIKAELRTELIEDRTNRQLSFRAWCSLSKFLR